MRSGQERAGGGRDFGDDQKRAGIGGGRIQPADFENPSLPWAWPEVWVADEDYDRALELISGFEKGRDEGKGPDGRADI